MQCAQTRPGKLPNRLELPLVASLAPVLLEDDWKQIENSLGDPVTAQLEKGRGGEGKGKGEGRASREEPRAPDAVFSSGHDNLYFEHSLECAEGRIQFFFFVTH